MSINPYYPLPELLPDAIIERALKLGTAQLCDGLKDLGVPQDGCMNASIMPVDGTMHFVGTAYTVETSNGDNLPLHVAIYQGKPGYVLVVDGKACTERAYMGDLMTSAAQAVGLSGIVVDGYVRDKNTLSEMRFPIFSRGFMQRGPIKKDPGSINTKIECSGVVVNPGDLVVGDYDGVTVVPRELVLQVLDNAEKKGNYETQRRTLIANYIECKANGSQVPDLTPNWVSEMLNKMN